MESLALLGQECPSDTYGTSHKSSHVSHTGWIWLYSCSVYKQDIPCLCRCIGWQAIKLGFILGELLQLLWEEHEHVGHNPRLHALNQIDCGQSHEIQLNLYVMLLPSCNTAVCKSLLQPWTRLCIAKFFRWTMTTVTWAQLEQQCRAKWAHVYSPTTELAVRALRNVPDTAFFIFWVRSASHEPSQNQLYSRSLDEITALDFDVWALRWTVRSGASRGQ